MTFIKSVRRGREWEQNELGNCGFCFESFDGKRGTKATDRVWSKDFSQYINVCRKHAEEIQASAYLETTSTTTLGNLRNG